VFHELSTEARDELLRPEIMLIEQSTPAAIADLCGSSS